jgi:hypothetical protein
MQKSSANSSMSLSLISYQGCEPGFLKDAYGNVNRSRLSRCQYDATPHVRPRRGITLLPSMP